MFEPRASIKIIKERFPKHEDGLELAYWCVLRREGGCWDDDITNVKIPCVKRTSKLMLVNVVNNKCYFMWLLGLGYFIWLLMLDNNKPTIMEAIFFRCMLTGHQ